MLHTLQSFHYYLKKHRVLRYPYSVLTIVVGVVVVLAGVAMLVLPGPGILTIFLGLTILSADIPCVKRLVDWLIAKAKGAKDALFSKNRGKMPKMASEDCHIPK